MFWRIIPTKPPPAPNGDSIRTCFCLCGASRRKEVGSRPVVYCCTKAPCSRCGVPRRAGWPVRQVVDGGASTLCRGNRRSTTKLCCQRAQGVSACACLCILGLWVAGGQRMTTSGAKRCTPHSLNGSPPSKLMDTERRQRVRRAPPRDHGTAAAECAKRRLRGRLPYVCRVE